VVSRERKDLVRNILEELPEKDRRILRAVFLEDIEKAEVCKRFDVNRDYLRYWYIGQKSAFARRSIKTAGNSPEIVRGMKRPGGGNTSNT